MRKHLNQHLFSPLSWLLVVLVVILLLLVLLFLTPLGPKTAAQIADYSLKELTLEGVSGSFLGGVHIEKFIWDNGTAVVLDKLDVKLKTYDFKSGRLSADQVQAERLSINLEDTQSTTEDVVIPDFGLPLNIDARVVTLTSLQINQKHQTQYPLGGIDKNDKGQISTLEKLFEINDLQLENLLIEDHQLHFGRLQGNPIILDTPLKINVTDGNLNMDQPHDLHTSGRVSFKHKDLGQAEGDINLKGTLTHYAFDSALDIRQIHIGKQKLTLTGKGDYKQVSFDSVKLSSSDGILTGKANVTWEPDVTWSFKGDGKGIKTKRWLPDWPATVNVKLNYQGSYRDEKLDNDVEILSLKGKLRGHALSAKGQLSHQLVSGKNAFSSKGLNIQLGENKLKLKGTTTTSLTEPLDLKLTIDAGNVSQLMPATFKSSLAGQLKGTVNLKGTLDNPVVMLKLNGRNLAYQDFKQGREALRLEGTVNVVNTSAKNPLITLKNMVAQSGRNRVAVSGIVANAANQSFDLKLDINAPDLNQLLENAGTQKLAGQINATAKLTGTRDKPQLVFKANARNLVFEEYKQGKQPLFVEGDIALDKASSSKPQITLKSIVAKTGKNTLQLSGVASESMQLKWKLDAQNLSQVSPDLGGRIIAEGELRGLYDSPVILANTLKASGLRYKDNKMGRDSIQAKGEIALKNGVPIVKNLLLNSGRNRISISGRASSPYDLQWDIDGKDLKQLIPELSGRLKAKGHLQGTIDKPMINATVEARNLRYQDMRLASGDFVATTQNGRYKIKGKLRNLAISGQKITTAKLTASGQIENHTVNLSFKKDQADVVLKASGGWRNQTWKGVLQKLQYKDKKAGNWMLQKPVQISAAKDKVNTSRFCLRGNAGGEKTQICSKVSWSKKSGIAAEGQLKKTPLALLKPWLPEGMQLNGNAEGTYTIKQYNGHPKGRLKITLPDSSFSFKTEDGEERTFSYQEANVTATINDRVINAKATMNVVNRGKFVSRATIKLSPENGKHTIDGSAQFDIPNINFMQEFIPHSRGLRGAFSSKMTFSGLLNKPKIIGRAALKNGYLRLPEAGTELTNINLNMQADRPGQAVINGKMLMGKGVLNVKGAVDARNPSKWSTNINISGKNIRFMNTNEIRAIMTPNLTIELTPKVIAFKGKVRIPEATINLKEIPELSIDESEDAIVLGEKKKGEQVSAVKVRPNVLIELGDKIKLNAFGLRAKLSGRVNITHNRRDILAQGSLKVTEGKYQAYGQNLDINNGRLIFNGSPKLVGMDIRATRKVDDKLVGVHLGGTVLKPKSKIFSDPTLPDSEALSLLLTGHTLSSASGQESALLMSAVRGLGVTGSDSLLNNIGSSLGLDDVNIVTKEDFRKSELALGKRLGSRLYVRYIVGLFDQAQKIAIDYKINKFLSLQAETSTEGNFGLDFIYKIERD